MLMLALGELAHLGRRLGLQVLDRQLRRRRAVPRPLWGHVDEQPVSFRRGSGGGRGRCSFLKYTFSILVRPPCWSRKRVSAGFPTSIGFIPFLPAKN